MSTATEILEFKGSSELISASLVYDGGDAVTIPPQMGAPRADQMQGTPAEQLCELAGRVCYDSLGKGRPSFSGRCTTCGGDGGNICHCGMEMDAHHQGNSCTSPRAMDCEKCGNTGKIEGYHDHIAKVGHGSVWEHFNFTTELPGGIDPQFFRDLLNRPGVYVDLSTDSIRLTMNLRSLVEWDKFSSDGTWRDEIGWIVARDVGSEVAPAIVKTPPHPRNGEPPDCCANLVDPINDNERWASLFISGSRGLSHELVRHGDFTAISQRSTRFVDESESEWVEHPLFVEFKSSLSKNEIAELEYATNGAVTSAQQSYRSCADALNEFLISRSIDKTSARKQARGAARGMLGNALYTELIFSASVAQWKRILRQRASQFADAEIREMACKALLALKQSRYGSSFDNWWLEKSPDGIGFIAVESSQ